MWVRGAAATESAPVTPRAPVFPRSITSFSRIGEPRVPGFRYLSVLIVWTRFGAVVGKIIDGHACSTEAGATPASPAMGAAEEEAAGSSRPVGAVCPAVAPRFSWAAASRPSVSPTQRPLGARNKHGASRGGRARWRRFQRGDSDGYHRTSARRRLRMIQATQSIFQPSGLR